MSQWKRWVRWSPLVALLIVAGTLGPITSAGAATAVRINTGGPTQTVDGVTWQGCTAVTSCGGYVTGGFPWAENPTSITGASSPDSPTIQKSEWTGGTTNGVPAGATAFSYSVPVSGSATYAVKLRFTENNKYNAGARVFDVRLNGSTVLSNFDIYKEAGGAFKTISRSFEAPAQNGKVNIDFVARVENAKISSIEVLGKDGSNTTTSSSTSTTTTAVPGTTATRVNTGGPAQNVDGTQWGGCTAINSCGGYVTGGFPWTENTGNIAGVAAPDSQTIQKSEWSGGRNSGVPAGATAFTFAIPAGASNTVNLRFTELNKDAVGQRIFDVKINGNTVLSNFDIYKEAGGNLKTILRSFNVPAQNGKVNIEFVARVENAKVSSIEVLGSGGTPGSTTSTTTSTTSTTQPSQPNGSNINWSAIAPSPQRTVESGGGSLGGKHYVFGGYPDSSYVPSRKAFVYDPATNAWSQLPDMPRGLTHTAMVEDGRSFIFAGAYADNVGGGGQVFAIDNVWRFDVDTKVWTALPKLPAPRGSGAMAKVGRTLHFFGGVNTSRQEQNNHWTLNLDNLGAGWQNAPAFPSPRTHFPTIVIGNSIYAIGGLVGIDAAGTEQGGVYKYDTMTNTWSTLASMPVPLSHISDATLLHDGKIWTFGGEPKHGQTTRSVYVYDPNTNKWSTSTPLPAGRFSGVASVINGVFYFSNGDFGTGTAWKGTIF